MMLFRFVLALDMRDTPSCCRAQGNTAWERSSSTGSDDRYGRFDNSKSGTGRDRMRLGKGQGKSTCSPQGWSIRTNRATHSLSGFRHKGIGRGK
jgi:hypothetical protein